MSLRSGITRVGVLRGGPSSEYDISLKTGGNILKILTDHEKYEPVDIFISKDGIWHLSGIPKEPHKILSQIDVVFNALHGSYGEDGIVQKTLDTFSIPYTGSGSVASAIGMNKELSKKIFDKNNFKVARHVILKKEEIKNEKLVEIFREMLHPTVVKPINNGSSFGINLAYDFNGLKSAIEEALKYSDKVLIEEYIRGKEVTCGVVENFRNQKMYVLLPIEIKRPSNKNFFDYESKYNGKSEKICPGNFSKQEKEEIQKMALLAHEILGMKHYSRSDFIVTSHGNVYILETNSLPELTEDSSLSKSLYSVGSNTKEFVEHLLELALTRK